MNEGVSHGAVPRGANYRECVGRRDRSGGNPVFSVVQTDIIVYGTDLADYVRHEFQPEGWTPSERPPRTIRFWTALLDAN